MSEWTQEQKLEQAQNNANAFILGTMKYLKDNAQSLDDWSNFMGKLFVGGWTEANGEGALSLAKRAAFNPIALGGRLVSVEGDDSSATAVFDFPINEMAAAYDVTLDEFDAAVSKMYGLIFDSLGANFTSERNGERWTYTVSY